MTSVELRHEAQEGNDPTDTYRPVDLPMLLELPVEPHEAVKDLIGANFVPDPKLGIVPTDNLRRYLNEIGAHPLLTSVQQRELARHYEHGRAASEFAHSEVLDRAQKRHLLALGGLGEQAKQRQIESNLRLVVSVARRYNHARSLELIDLIQEGNIGLLRAVEKFDWRKGFQFSTYATWWIRQGVTRGLADKDRLVRIPVHIGDKLSAIDVAARALFQDLQREPTTEEIAEHTNIAVEKVEEVLGWQAMFLSFDEPVGDGDAELGDLLPDSSVISEDTQIDKIVSKQQVEALLDRLTEREREIISDRFGLIDGIAKTLEEVGKKHNVTRERIRQIESKTLSQMRTAGNINDRKFARGQKS